VQGCGVAFESLLTMANCTAEAMSVDTRKRSGSTGTCATSPVKKTKSPMVKIMKNIWASNLPKIHFLVIS